MKKFGWRLLAAVLALCLPLSASADVGGMNQLLSRYFGAEGSVRMSVGFELEQLNPYGQETVDMMNGILRHTTLDAVVDGTDMRLSMCVDGQPQFSMQETLDDDGWKLTTDLLPNRILTSENSPIETLFPEESSQLFGFDMQKSVEAAEAGYQQLGEAIVPYAEEKEANYKISYVGRANWVRLAKLDAETTVQLMPLIKPLLTAGMDKAIVADLQAANFKNGLTVALYFTEEGGQPIALYMKGNANFAENDNRTLTYVWAFTREENGSRKDSFKLELLKGKGKANKYLAECLQLVALEGDKLTYSGKLEMERKVPGVNYTYQQKEELTGSLGDQPTLGGTITATDRTDNGETTLTFVTEYTPQLTLIPGENGSVLTGSIGCTVTRSKKPQTVFTITLGADPLVQEIAREEEPSGETDVILTIQGGSLSQNQGNVSDFLVGSPPLGVTMYAPPADPVLVNLDTQTADERAALEDEMFQYAAGYLLKVLPFIQEEDTGLLRDNLSEEDYDVYVNQAEYPD